MATMMDISFKSYKTMYRRHRAKLWKDFKVHPEKYQVERDADGGLRIMDRGSWMSFDRKEVETDNPNYYAYPIR